MSNCRQGLLIASTNNCRDLGCERITKGVQVVDVYGIVKRLMQLFFEDFRIGRFRKLGSQEKFIEDATTSRSWHRVNPARANQFQHGIKLRVWHDKLCLRVFLNCTDILEMVADISGEILRRINPVVKS